MESFVENIQTPRVQRSQLRRTQGNRRGAAIFELAVCIPFLLLTSLGLIELCNMVFVSSRIQSVAYEGARIATRPTTASQLALTSSQVIATCGTMLTQLGVKGGQVTLSPVNITSLAPQTLVTVTVTAPLNQNNVSSYVVNNSTVLTAKATLIME